jgi:hypothetical protein
MPRFFVPGHPEDQAETEWQRLRESCVRGATTERRIFSIRFRHNARDYVARVGDAIVYLVGELPNRTEQPLVPSSQVLAIFERADQELYYICWYTDDERQYALVSNPFLVGASDARIEDFGDEG